MTRKDYQLIANALGRMLKSTSQECLPDVIHPVLECFQEDNPNFNPNRFITAINIAWEKENGF